MWFSDSNVSKVNNVNNIISVNNINNLINFNISLYFYVVIIALFGFANIFCFSDL